MEEFASDEHIASLDREHLEELCRYLRDRRADVVFVCECLEKEKAALKERVKRQSAQLKEVQTALGQRNNGELKKRWQRQVKALERENERLRELLAENGVEVVK